MNKIGLIIGREFNQRVRKRSFIITTIVTPILMIGLMVAPALIMMLKTDKAKVVLVVDHSGMIAPELKNDKQLVFEKSDKTVDQLRAEKRENIYGILAIGTDVKTNPSDVQLYAYEATTLDIENQITSQIQKIIEADKLKGYDIENLPQIMSEIKTNVVMQAYQISDAGDDKESSSILSMVLAYVFGFMIYMFVFIYGAMVMQGVVEEKSSKVLEIMVSSVRPFELMLGKILGIAAVAITQFVIWIVVILVLGTAITQFFAADILAAGASAAGSTGAIPAEISGMNPEAMTAIKGVTDIGYMFKIFGAFLIYFIGGYLLYAAMFAAIGSAVDNVQDTQQLQLPVTIPMILALLVMMNVMTDPNSQMAFWFSMIPLTSPIIMMARIPYGVPAWEIVTSIVLLYASFLGMVWVAGKVYRVGIFMYGKKPGFKELYKWIKYK